jgi:hypothetical protein
MSNITEKIIRQVEVSMREILKKINIKILFYILVLLWGC